MKEWAQWFYSSPAWKQTRRAYAASQHGLCEWCGGVGEIVHHSPPLTPQTVRDTDATLGWEHLTLLCRSCHLIAHGGSRPEGAHFDAEGNLVRD